MCINSNIPCFRDCRKKQTITHILVSVLSFFFLFLSFVFIRQYGQSLLTNT